MTARPSSSSGDGRSRATLAAATARQSNASDTSVASSRVNNSPSLKPLGSGSPSLKPQPSFMAETQSKASKTLPTAPSATQNVLKRRNSLFYVAPTMSLDDAEPQQRQ